MRSTDARECRLASLSQGLQSRDPPNPRRAPLAGRPPAATDPGSTSEVPDGASEAKIHNRHFGSCRQRRSRPHNSGTMKASPRSK